MITTSAPKDLTKSSPFPGLAVVATWHLKKFLAIYIARVPTPPAPPEMNTLLFSLTPAF